MGRYLIARGVQAVVSLVVVSIVVFGLVRLTGDPVEVMAPQEATEEQIAALRAHLGLDQPFVVQYGRFVGQALQGDFGTSIRFSQPVSDLVMSRLPASLQLGVLAMVIALAIAIPAGVLAAASRGSLWDVLARGFAALGQAVPSFWLGLLLVLVFAVHLGWFPTSGFTGVASIVLPAVTLGWYVAAGLMRLTRSSMLDVLGSDYVKFARVKGVPPQRVLWKHAFRNAALPVMTFGALLFVHVLNGSVIVETVFAWPGVGLLVIEAVEFRDYPVVQGVVLMLATMYIVVNFVVDMLYAVIDPKIRVSS